MGEHKMERKSVILTFAKSAHGPDSLFDLPDGSIRIMITQYIKGCSMMAIYNSIVKFLDETMADPPGSLEFNLVFHNIPYQWEYYHEFIRQFLVRHSLASLCFTFPEGNFRMVNEVVKNMRMRPDRLVLNLGEVRPSQIGFMRLLEHFETSKTLVEITPPEMLLSRANYTRMKEITEASGVKVNIKAEK